MLTQNDLDRLNRISDEIEDLKRPLRVGTYNAPLNRDEEKGKFLEAYRYGKAYNPRFVFQSPPENWTAALWQYLDKLDPSLSIWDRLICEDLESDIEGMHIIAEHDPSVITERSIRKYKLPSADLVHQARELLNSTGWQAREVNDINTDDAVSFFRQALNKVGLTDWQVIVKQPMNARVAVRSIDRQILIRQDAMFSHTALQRLLVHEIGTHVFRYMNGSSQPLRLLRRGMGDFLETEEGLAAFHEKQYGVIDTLVMRRYASRVLAASLSLNHSFHEVFSLIAAYTDEEDAFGCVLRAKRGFTDTSQYGAHVKDKIYFEGYLNITQHMAASPADHDLLLAGKLSLSMLPAARQLRDEGWLTPPKYLPSQLI